MALCLSIKVGGRGGGGGSLIFLTGGTDLALR